MYSKLSVKTYALWLLLGGAVIAGAMPTLAADPVPPPAGKVPAKDAKADPKDTDLQKQIDEALKELDKLEKQSEKPDAGQPGMENGQQLLLKQILGGNGGGQLQVQGNMIPGKGVGRIGGVGGVGGIGQAELAQKQLQLLQQIQRPGIDPLQKHQLLQELGRMNRGGAQRQNRGGVQPGRGLAQPGQLLQLLEQMQQPGVPGIVPGNLGLPPLGGQEVRLGVLLESPDPILTAQLDLPKDQGIVVKDVFPDSPAAKAGLKPLDIILELDGKLVTNKSPEFNGLVGDIKSATTVDAVVLRKGRKETIKGIYLP